MVEKPIFKIKKKKKPTTYALFKEGARNFEPQNSWVRKKLEIIKSEVETKQNFRSYGKKVKNRIEAGLVRNRKQLRSIEGKIRQIQKENKQYSSFLGKDFHHDMRRLEGLKKLEENNQIESQCFRKTREKIRRLISRRREKNKAPPPNEIFLESAAVNDKIKQMFVEGTQKMTRLRHLTFKPRRRRLQSIDSIGRTTRRFRKSERIEWNLRSQSTA
jgi:hypothetical protein